MLHNSSFSTLFTQFWSEHFTGEVQITYGNLYHPVEKLKPIFGIIKPVFDLCPQICFGLVIIDMLNLIQ